MTLLGFVLTCFGTIIMTLLVVWFLGRRIVANELKKAQKVMEDLLRPMSHKDRKNLGTQENVAGQIVNLLDAAARKNVHAKIKVYNLGTLIQQGEYQIGVFRHHDNGKEYGLFHILIDSKLGVKVESPSLLEKKPLSPGATREELVTYVTPLCDFVQTWGAK